jgi:hypothetical protein
VTVRARIRLPGPLALALLAIVGGSSLAIAQPLPLKVTPDSSGFVQLSRGSQRLRVDLRMDVPGCIGELRDSSTGERFKAGAPLRVLDVSARDNRHYILLAAIAQPNCNVQGMCGAPSEPNVNLIWLNVTAELAVDKKQVVAVEDCRKARSAEGLPENWPRQFHLVNDKISIAFTDYSPDRPDVVGKAEYDRQSPDAGIRVTLPKP